MDISVTAEINGAIEVEHVVKNTVIQTVTVVSLPAAFVGSVSITELAKSIAGQTFTITGANFDASTVITSTAGTVTGIVVNSANSVSVTITGGTGTGYKDVTATTTAGTHTLSNCIRMYTRVIPGTDVSWLDITGSTLPQTGAGYIRSPAYVTINTQGASFLVTTTNADFEITFVTDITNIAFSLQRGAWGLTYITPNTGGGAGSRADYYLSKTDNQNPSLVLFRNQQTFYFLHYYTNTFTVNGVFKQKRVNGIVYSAIEGEYCSGGAYTQAGTVYMDFNTYTGAGYKNILAKVYD